MPFSNNSGSDVDVGDIAVRCVGGEVSGDVGDEVGFSVGVAYSIRECTKGNCGETKALYKNPNLVSNFGQLTHRWFGCGSLFSSHSVKQILEKVLIISVLKNTMLATTFKKRHIDLTIVGFSEVGGLVGGAWKIIRSIEIVYTFRYHAYPFKVEPI